MQRYVKYIKPKSQRTRPPKKPPTPPEKPPTPPLPPSTGDEDERAKFYTTEVTLMNCTPGNYDHPEGEPNAIVTVARPDSIEPMTFKLGDVRTLATRLLVVLATYDDAFAKTLLADSFSSDDEGNYIWPKQA